MLALAIGIAPAGHTEDPANIGTLSKLDQAFMAQQRTLIGDLATFNLGRQFRGNKAQDLDLLQALLDRRIVRNDQTRELQAMGIILGDLLAAEYDMHWVVYQDDLGRSRGLRYRQTDFVLFPVTMISRRREVGNKEPVREMYQQAADAIIASRPPLPFQ